MVDGDEGRVVVDQQRREPAGELVLDVAGERAEEHVRTDAVFEEVVDRADLQRSLDLPECLLVDFELFAGTRGAGGGDARGGLVGAQDVDTFKQRFLLDLGDVALVAERAAGDLKRDARGILRLLTTRPTRSPITPAAAFRSRPRSPWITALTFASSASVASRSALRLRACSAATCALRQTISRLPENCGAEISTQPLLVKQRQLEIRCDRQRRDLRGSERSDEPDCLLLERDGASFADHPAVPDEHDAVDPEAIVARLDRRGEHVRVSRVALVHLYRDRPPSGEQHNL